MDIIEIINREGVLEQSEMEFVVEEYIREKTGRIVKIFIFPNLFVFQSQINYLLKCFLIAGEYFKNK